MFKFDGSSGRCDIWLYCSAETPVDLNIFGVCVFLTWGCGRPTSRITSGQVADVKQSFPILSMPFVRSECEETDGADSIQVLFSSLCCVSCVFERKNMSGFMLEWRSRRISGMSRMVDPWNSPPCSTVHLHLQHLCVPNILLFNFKLVVI